MDRKEDRGRAFVKDGLDALHSAAIDHLARATVDMPHATKEDRYDVRLRWIVVKTQQIMEEMRKDITSISGNTEATVKLLVNLGALNAVTTAVSLAMGEDQKEENAKPV